MAAIIYHQRTCPYCDAGTSRTTGRFCFVCEGKGILNVVSPRRTHFERVVIQDYASYLQDAYDEWGYEPQD